MCRTFVITILLLLVSLSINVIFLAFFRLLLFLAMTWAWPFWTRWHFVFTILCDDVVNNNICCRRFFVRKNHLLIRAIRASQQFHLSPHRIVRYKNGGSPETGSLDAITENHWLSLWFFLLRICWRFTISLTIFRLMDILDELIDWIDFHHQWEWTKRTNTSTVEQAMRFREKWEWNATRKL